MTRRLLALPLLLAFVRPAGADDVKDPGYINLPALRNQKIEVTQSLAVDDAPTKSAVRLLKALIDVEATQTVSEANYQASIDVKPKLGVYRWDCSGMMTWLLRRAAPTAFAALGDSRPVARDFVRAIEAAPTRKVRKGWQRIANISEIRPGDIFAFRRAAISTSKVTGHVGVIISKPVPVVEWSPSVAGGTVWLVRIADSTRIPHYADTRVAPQSGFGLGTVAFATDTDGNVIGYGWHGPASAWIIKTTVVFGRLHN
jgi:hypothetical protein